MTRLVVTMYRINQALHLLSAEEHPRPGRECRAGVRGLPESIGKTPARVPVRTRAAIPSMDDDKNLNRMQRHASAARGMPAGVRRLPGSADAVLLRPPAAVS
ncbi:MAG: hypothetical protein KGJ32_12900 [Xanthomonadaceae bacterium]|nr:hypothetical protein [Xanthomonadaceae bacterium]